MRASGLAIRVVGFRGVGFEVSSSGFARATGQGAGNARAHVGISIKGHRQFPRGTLISEKRLVVHRSIKTCGFRVLLRCVAFVYYSGGQHTRKRLYRTNRHRESDDPQRLCRPAVFANCRNRQKPSLTKPSIGNCTTFRADWYI